MFAFNQGEVCTCPSRALVQENRSTTGSWSGAEASGWEIKQGDPLEPTP